jgi:hypothetical protein
LSGNRQLGWLNIRASTSPTEFDAAIGAFEVDGNVFELSAMRR